MNGKEREQTGMQERREAGTNGKEVYKTSPSFPFPVPVPPTTLTLTLEQYEDERRRYGRRRLWGWDRIVVDGVVVKESKASYASPIR